MRKEMRRNTIRKQLTALLKNDSKDFAGVARIVIRNYAKRLGRPLGYKRQRRMGKGGYAG